MHYYLIYRSIETIPLSKCAFEELVTTSKNRNNLYNITGVLLYRNKTYLQYIEGSKQEIILLFEKILSDKRHKDIQVLYKGFRKERKFPSWTMKLLDMSYEQIRWLSDYNNPSEPIENKSLGIEAQLDIIENGRLNRNWEN